MLLQRSTLIEVKSFFQKGFFRVMKGWAETQVGEAGCFDIMIREVLENPAGNSAVEHIQLSHQLISVTQEYAHGHFPSHSHHARDFSSHESVLRQTPTEKLISQFFYLVILYS